VERLLFFHRRVGWSCHGAALALLLASCSHELNGPEPSVDEGQEATLCGDIEDTFVVTGQHFSPMVVDGATDEPGIDLPDVCLLLVERDDGTEVDDAEETCLPEDSVEWVSQERLEFRIGPDERADPGVYDVIIRNPDGREASERFRLTILADGPLLFWVDPQAVYDGISTQITLYGSGLGGATSAAIVDDAGAETEIDFNADAERPNRISAIVPMGTAVGEYDVELRDANGCHAALPDGLQVTDTLSLTIAAIAPEFGFNDGSTPVTITGSGFQSIPRAYLNPAVPMDDTVASTLISLAWLDQARLTAVVPEGLPAGRYDLIVVNPDATVGVLEDAFLVTAAPPPVIDSVTPGFVDNGDPVAVTITGDNFDDPGVGITCIEPGGTEFAGDATVGDVSASSVDATLPVDGLPAGTVCIVRVTNADGSYFDYSAIGVSTPASNLSPFAQGTNMATARRAPAVAAGRATRAARFVYAVGGDDGSPTGALDSVEAVPVDVFGVPGEWFTQPVSLPAPRTLAGVVTIGRFLYVVGGHDGTAATASVLRAQVLDPLQAPEILDVAARRGEDGEGIGAGVWYYRVSAVMADDDPSNPGGETLASEPLAINLPDALDGTVVLTVSFSEVPGAQSYRIYRSRDPDLPAGSEQRLAEVDADVTAYEDASGAPAGAGPLPLGATGVWVELAELTTPRAAAGVTVAHDPEDADVFHIYAVGGRDAQDDPIASYEYLVVTQAGDGTQATGAWTEGDDALPAARSELSAYSVSNAEAAVVTAGTTLLYAGGGLEATDVDAAEVQAGGGLAAWTAIDDMSPGRAGYGGVAGAGFLFAFGGQMGRPADSNVSAEISGSPPAVINWNNEGDRLIVPRYLAGTAVESAFIYVVGGETEDGVTATTERTVL
jgi:hypothetical protein